MRPFAPAAPVKQGVVDSLLAREVDLHQLAPALLGHFRDRAVAGDSRVVDDYVNAVGEVLGDLLRRLAGGDVELDCFAADSLITLRSSSAAWGTSSPTTLAPSRPRVAAIAAPIPREAPVTRATLPSSGRSQSISGVGKTPRLDPEYDLTGDVGRARREQEAQGRGELDLRRRGDEH